MRLVAGLVALALTPVTLPAPTGPLPLGVTTMHLVDSARRDPWNGTTRELMITIYYPARTTAGYPAAHQMTPAAASFFAQIDAGFLHPVLPDEGIDWSATTGHAHVDAPARRSRYPVLLYTPAAADPRTLGTGPAEELASHGYIVVTVDHPGETSEVEFPDGRVRVVQLPGDPRTDSDLFATLVSTRIADLRFVLDSLAVLGNGGNPSADGRPLPAGLGRALDLGRVGVYGHSAGGTAAAQLMADDRRVDAAANLEGYLDLPDGTPFPVAVDGPDRPLLLAGTDGYRDERYDRSWAVLLAHCPRWTTVVRFTGASHWAFTDYVSMLPQLVDRGLMSASDSASMIGADPPVRAIALRLRSFFDRYV